MAEASGNTPDNSLDPGSGNPEDRSSAPEIDYEREAARMGHQPKDKFRGDPDKWIDAKTYYENGKNVLPIIKAENNELRRELVRVKEQAAAFVEVAERANAREVAALQTQLAEAKEVRKQAITEGNGEAFELADGDVKRLEAEAAAASRTTTKPPATDPVFEQWKLDNPWFDADPIKKARAVAIATGRPDLHGKHRELYDYVAREIQAFDDFEASGRNVDRDRPGPQRGGRPSGAGTNAPAKRSYENLQTEFKAKCDQMYKDFGIKSDKKAWQDRYVNGCTDEAFR